MSMRDRNYNFLVSYEISNVTIITYTNMQSVKYLKKLPLTDPNFEDLLEEEIDKITMISTEL